MYDVVGVGPELRPFAASTQQKKPYADRISQKRKESIASAKAMQMK